MKTTKPFWKAHLGRTKLLSHARQLARSGQHPDHRSIIMQMELADGFGDAHRLLVRPGISAQLDKLCTMAAPTRNGVGQDQHRFTKAPTCF